MSETSSAAARITDLTDEIRGNLGAVEDATVRAVRAAWVPSPLADTVRSAVDEYTDGVRWLLARIDSLLDGAAFVDTLADATDRWRPLGPALGSTGSDIAQLRSAAAASWEGKGGAGYTELLQPQSVAAQRSAEVADGAARATAVLAGTGRTFYLALAVALSGFAAAVSGLPSRMSSIATAPAALSVAATAAASLADFLGRATTALEQQVTSASAKASTLTQAASDSTVFPDGGRWPDPGAGLGRSGESQ